MTLPEEGADAKVATAVTALFVPGDRPERFAKAASSGADVVIIDLEDAVAEQDRESARRSILDHLAGSGQSLRAVIRINALGSAEASRDLTLVRELRQHSNSALIGIMIAKAESAESIRKYIAETTANGTSIAIVPLIESAQGLAVVRDIAGIVGVTRLAFGAVDYALDIGADDSHGALDAARSALVLASRLATIAAPLDSPSIEIRDLSVVEDAARRARSYGFGGKLCIHPAQVGAVVTAFLPTEAEIDWAISIVGHGASAGQINGQMIDRPVIERAKRILLLRQLSGS